MHNITKSLLCLILLIFSLPVMAKVYFIKATNKSTDAMEILYITPVPKGYSSCANLAHETKQTREIYSGSSKSLKFKYKYHSPDMKICQSMFDHQ